jgi:hypothetical protein
MPETDNTKPTIIKAGGRWPPKNLNYILQFITASDYSLKYSG